MQTSKHGFELNDDGNIKVALLTGFKMAPIAGISCIVKIDYAETAAAVGSGDTKSLQLNLSPVQVRMLGESLVRKAAELEAAEPTSTQ